MIAWRDMNPGPQMLQIGLAALERAMRAPTRVIVENAGEEGSVIVGKLLENDADSSIGYNAAKGEATRLSAGKAVLSGMSWTQACGRRTMQASTVGCLITVNNQWSACLFGSEIGQSSSAMHQTFRASAWMFDDARCPGQLAAW